MSKVKIALSKLHCIEETDEVGSDEPYVLVFAAELKNIAGLVNVPAASTIKYGPWDNVDKGDVISTTIFGIPPANLWGLDGKPQEISTPENIIILVALMENDDASTGGVREGLHAQMFASITSYANAGISHVDMIKKLKRDMRDILTGVTVTGIPNSDDLVNIAHLSFSRADLQKASSKTVIKKMTLSGDGGKYELTFEMSK